MQQQQLSQQQQQPPDSGVGVSVAEENGASGAAAATPSQSFYATREFSKKFHKLVAACCSLQDNERPKATEIKSDPFCKQVKQHTAKASASID